MSIAKESQALIKQHMKAKYNWDMTEEDLKSMPHHEQVWEWWMALAYFQIGQSYERLEDAPDGLEWIRVMGESVKNYKWKDGKYIYVQEFTKELCKETYGK